MRIKQFEKRDFSKNPSNPDIEIVSVEDWQSPQTQDKVAPEVILYVIAPHHQFPRDDQQYLKEFLKTLKQLYPSNRVIFVLNIHHTDSGEPKATPANIEDVRNNVAEIWGKFYSNQPPIVEVNALKGEGIAEVAKLMCQILPHEKLGNIENVLKSELKQYAQEERRRGYLKNVIAIALTG